MKKIMILCIITAALITSIALTGCVEETENKIIVGTSADYPPFEYVENGKIVGFDIELITSLLEKLGYTVEVQDIGFDSLIPSLVSNKIDVIAAAMTITPEREEQIDLSDPYYNSDQSILVQTDSDVNIDEYEDLSNLIIGTQTGTTGELWVIENLINITNATMTDDQLKSYDTYTLAVLDLDNGNLDAIILDIPNPWDAVGHAYKALKPGGYLCTYSPLSSQVENTVKEIKKHSFIEIFTVENIQRKMVVSDKGMRPSFDMLGHTGYLTFARKVLL